MCSSVALSSTDEIRLALRNHKASDDQDEMAERIAFAMGFRQGRAKRLIRAGLDGDLTAEMRLLVLALPGWGIGGDDYPDGTIVAELYSPDGSKIIGEGRTFTDAVLDAILAARASCETR